MPPMTLPDLQLRYVSFLGCWMYVQEEEGGSIYWMRDIVEGRIRVMPIRLTQVDTMGSVRALRGASWIAYSTGSASSLRCLPC